MRSIALVALVALGGCQWLSDNQAADVVPFVSRPVRHADLTPRPGPQRKLQVRLRDVPPAVRLGGRLAYIVEISNPTGKDIELDPCPAYYSAFGEGASAITVRSYLNCNDAPAAVPAQGSLRFAMEMRIFPTGDIQPGFVGSVYWRLPAAGPSRHWDDSSPDVRVIAGNG